jgi:SAM-dependent methyltransferase
MEKSAVALTADALIQTQRAFDGVAGSYDRANRANPLIAAMRERTLAALTDHVAPGACLIDLGCGPGTDAIALGSRGYRVTAVDWSPAMVAETRARVAGLGLDSHVQVRHLGIHQLQVLSGKAFDAAYSNLGPLNCVPHLEEAARAIADRLRPGGIFVASVIGRVCPWEIARYGLTGHWRRVGVRFKEGFVPVPLEGRTVWTRYYDPVEFERLFAAAGFRLLTRRALGLLTPPPYLEGFAARHARWIDRLQRLEDRTAHWPILNRAGDHFLSVMVRR